MLHKIDILPMQVRIDAIIAEVTLNDSLQYGTQFFFKSGGVNGVLNNASTTITTPATTALGTSFPGFCWAAAAGRRARRDLRAAGGHHGQRAVLPADHRRRQPAGPPAGRRPGALPDAARKAR